MSWELLYLELQNVCFDNNGDDDDVHLNASANGNTNKKKLREAIVFICTIHDSIKKSRQRDILMDNNDPTPFRKEKKHIRHNTWMEILPVKNSNSH
jgi:hypothetical protein